MRWRQKSARVWIKGRPVAGRMPPVAATTREGLYLWIVESPRNTLRKGYARTLYGAKAAADHAAAELRGRAARPRKPLTRLETLLGGMLLASFPYLLSINARRA